VVTTLEPKGDALGLEALGARAPGICSDGAFRPVVCLPVFDHAQTVGAVAGAVLAQGLSLLAVDDGSGDGSGAALERAGAPAAISFPKNRGKGAALRAAFAEARRRGFTHAVTIDADGQHDPRDLPAVLRAARRTPEALVLGVRRLPAGGLRPLRSALLRLHSNAWVFLATRRWLPDTQTGFRAAPLGGLAALDPAGDRYDFELDWVIRWARAGLPVSAVKVRACYGPGARSHFRPLSDFLLCARAWLAASGRHRRRT